MQTELPTKTVDPKREIKEVWRCQASENIDDHVILCEVEDSVRKATTWAVMNETMNFEATLAL